MKKLSLTLFYTLIFLFAAHAQLVVNSGLTPAQVVAGFMGSGLTVSNINLNCASNACGTFSNGNTTNIGITNGSIFTTGSAAGAIGPNNSTSYSVSNGTYTSDPDLTTIEPQATNDPCILTFNVIPSCNTLTIRFVFGSEEYPEFVNSGFNDAFGFFITGPNPSGPAYSGYNVARLPNGTPVSIDNVNSGNNAAYYFDNTGGTTIQYDGFTTVITSNLAVVPCQSYFFKIAIADAGDYVYDSGVFIDLLTCSTAINTTSSSTPTCGCNGTASISASGGQPPYTYVWNTTPAQNTPTATGLCPGSYVVTVFDQTGCNSQSNQSTVVVNSSPAGTASIASQTNVGCNGGNNGSATANISGGTAPYTYAWNTIPAQNTQTATGLSSGTYNVTITDGNGCASVASVTISQPNPLTSGITSFTNVSCNGGGNGSATVNVGGGTPNYTYVWNTAPVQNTQTANNLPAGTYSVTVTDANGCTSVASVTINQPAALTSTVSASSQTGCSTATGTATANGSGGTPNYTYIWSTSPSQNSQTATGLAIGIYTVVITDANGCTSAATVNISAAAAPTIASTSVTPAACSVANGTASATASGGTPNYTYLWNTSPVQNTQTATGLSGGVYTIIITDASGCSVTANITVPSTAAPATTATSVNAKCGQNNGSATASPSGGTSPYTYSWSTSPVQNTQTANNLSAGTYTVLVTDASGCTATATVAINASSNPTVTAAVSNTISCNGGKNGSATANSNGGTPAYTYQWSTSPAQNTQTATGLGAGTYIVTVYDANGCSSQSSITISQPSPLTANVTSTNVKCNGGNSGSATATMNGGTSPYTYAWSNNESTQTATGLSQGNYSVIIYDANGCSAQSSVNIIQPQPLSVSPSQVNVKCNGGKNGSATVTPAGGTSPYTYSWNTVPPQNTQTANNLGAGNYTVTTTDNNGCTTIATFTITQPPPITLTVSGNDSICLGKHTTLTASTSGGTPAYTYVWTPNFQGGSSVNVSPTSNTTYSVTMTDANGCVSQMQTFNVLVMPSPKADFDTASIGNFSSMYSFTDSSIGGNSYWWNFGDPNSSPNTSTQQNPVHTFSGAGTYTVTEIVYNKFGCPDTFKRIITVYEGILIPNVFTPDNDGQNDVWYIPNSGMKEFHVEIFNRWGEKVFETTADEIRWDGRSDSGKPLNDGTYYYSLHAILKSGAAGKDYSTKGYVTLLRKK